MAIKTPYDQYIPGSIQRPIDGPVGRIRARMALKENPTGGIEGQVLDPNSSAQPASVRDPLGARLNINPTLLEQYISSPAGQSGGGAKLRGARVFSAQDRPGYSPDPGVTEAYAGFYDWMKTDKERLRAHEEYVALSKEAPGRRESILGSSQGSNQTVLGATV